ncbi:hypothetical protein KGF57_003232 [Candida theae]|uniref:Uncharacterized protein n=1 Tax=Candida theae TaxID=1198502 RepID=A0AAD5BDS5_9ASCO|nr:uncharacterized protein KGF57_003232 [Candida theae]KAI5957538.1 hypothetical protein KGF57_003232 [Candida theae]
MGLYAVRHPRLNSIGNSRNSRSGVSGETTPSSRVWHEKAKLLFIITTRGHHRERYIGTGQRYTTMLRFSRILGPISPRFLLRQAPITTRPWLARSLQTTYVQHKLFGGHKKHADPLSKSTTTVNPAPVETAQDDPLKSSSSQSPLPAEGPTEHDFKTHPILKRVPKFLRNYTAKFVNAPFSHLVAFIVLHELTAVIPLIGIWYYLHQHPGFIPLDLPQWALTKGAKVIDSAMGQFDWSFNTSDKLSVIMEGAYAFTIVKLFLPVRVVISLWGMPWFAKWFVLPITNLFGNWKKLRRAKKEGKPVDARIKTKQVDKPRL